MSNEDAWFARVSRNGALAVVADGMGSRPEARTGSLAAVAACRTAWRLWARSPAGSGEDLVKLIEVLWRLELGRTPQNEASTTCLVGAFRADGSGVALQLGDGLIGICDAAGLFRPVTPERRVFSTTTQALGTPHGLRDWVIEPLVPFEPGATMLLASDGVADDLLPDKRASFASWIVRTAQASSAPRQKLARALRAWPVPKHHDDKTIIAVWEATP